jgi:hypothetical protein
MTNIEQPNVALYVYIDERGVINHFSSKIIDHEKLDQHLKSIGLQGFTINRVKGV